MNTGKSKVMESSCRDMKVESQINGEQLWESAHSSLWVAFSSREKLLRRNHSRDWTGYDRHGKSKADMENRQHFTATIQVHCAGYADLQLMKAGL